MHLFKREKDLELMSRKRLSKAFEKSIIKVEGLWLISLVERAFFFVWFSEFVNVKWGSNVGEDVVGAKLLVV